MMTEGQRNNPMHGVKLEQIVRALEEHFGWDALALRISINCFKFDPSLKSSLAFLRKTPWAREKVEALYMETFIDGARPAAENPWGKSASDS